MPNGDPNWYREVKPKLDAFFGQIADMLEEFATNHNLLIDKYYHQGDDWTFRFRHPQGGSAAIQVNRHESDGVMIGAAWQIADYDSGTLLSRHTDMVKCTIEESRLRDMLRETLLTILGWKKKDLEPNKHKFTEWKEISKADFERRPRTYPFPKIE
jgi:hypothetical protein